MEKWGPSFIEIHYNYISTLDPFTPSAPRTCHLPVPITTSTYNMNGYADLWVHSPNSNTYRKQTEGDRASMRLPYPTTVYS
jgi:hypothetical protein